MEFAFRRGLLFQVQVVISPSLTHSTTTTPASVTLASGTTTEATVSDPYGKEAAPEESFTFCIGHPWAIDPRGHPSGDALCIYNAYGVQVHHGTMGDAETLRSVVEARTGYKTIIYKLVQV